MKVPFFRPYITDDEIDEVTDSLRKGWLTTGPKTRQFESDFSAFLGDETLNSIAVNSATAGLHLALEAIGVGPGDEVIVPDYTFTATAEVVRYLGADPVMVDVDYDTFNVTAQKIEAKITNKTKACMPVHFAGLPCDMPAILAMAKRHNIMVVDDAAHALPSFVNNTMIGRFDTAATVFSFYANKTITTGEGGMIVTSSDQYADRIRTMRLHGIDRDAFDRFHTGSWRYDVVAPGYKYNMSDIAAALGVHQLKKANMFRKERARVAARYRAGLEGLPLEMPMDGEDENHSWHLFIVRVADKSPLNRDELFQHLADHQITCSVHYTPLHQFKYWRERYDLKATDFNNAERLGQSVISLPMYVGMPEEETDFVIETIKGAIGS